MAGALEIFGGKKGVRLATSKQFFPSSSPKQISCSFLILSRPLHVEDPFPAALILPPPSSSLHHISMIKRGSPLNARKNNTKPSQAAAQKHTVDLAEDCSAAIAESVCIAAPPAFAPASAPAPASVPVVPGAQLPAAIEGGILPGAGRDPAQLSLGEAPFNAGSTGASMEPPSAPAPAFLAPASASAPTPARAPASASAPPPARAPAPAPAAPRMAPSFSQLVSRAVLFLFVVFVVHDSEIRRH